MAAIVAFWPLRGEERLALARASLRRFGILAALSVGVLGATGLYYAGRQVASLDSLLTTLYGQALLAKIGLLLVAGALGLLNAMLVHPGLAARLAAILGRPSGWTPLARRRLRPLLLAEVSAGLAVLAAAALLTATIPARGPEFAPAATGFPTNVRSSRSLAAEDVVVTLSARPNRAGPQRLPRDRREFQATCARSDQGCHAALQAWRGGRSVGADAPSRAE